MESKANALAETDTVPKEAICQLSAQKSKPNFDRPLCVTIRLQIALIATSFSCVFLKKCQRPVIPYTIIL